MEKILTRRFSLTQEPQVSRILDPIPNPLPEGYNQNWKVYVDGVLTEAHHIALVNDVQHCQVDLGNNPSNRWSQFVYREVHGGGTVSVPFAINTEGHVFVGTVDVIRPFRDPRPDHTVTELPRGFRAPEESAAQAAQRETQEETGHAANTAAYFPLEGEGACPNSTYWITWNKETQQPDGITYMATQVPWEALVVTDSGAYKLAVDTELDVFEGIKKSTFVPFHLTEMSGLGDMFIHTGLLRLLAHFNESHTVTFENGVVTIN